MATVARSPRRALTAEEKAARDAKYKIELKDFGPILKNLSNVFKSLVVLNSAMAQVPKGSFLAFPDGRGNFVPFTRKNLKTANAQFAKSLTALKNYLRVSRKRKAGADAGPQSFKGTYIPVQAGQALVDFLNNNPAGFGFLNPLQQGGPSLMEYLPNARQGTMLRNTATMLFFIYAHQNSLLDAQDSRFARSDQHMEKCFGGTVPASFYSYRGVDGKPDKVPMEVAIQRGYITQPLNTFEVIGPLYPEGTVDKRNNPKVFKPEKFNTCFFQNIAAANYYSRALLPKWGLQDAAEALSQPDLLAAMMQEHNIVKQASTEWHEFLAPERARKAEAKKAAKKRTK
jgi:hypothetical protein